jgi:hypothetical protein
MESSHSIFQICGFQRCVNGIYVGCNNGVWVLVIYFGNFLKSCGLVGGRNGLMKFRGLLCKCLRKVICEITIAWFLGWWFLKQPRLIKCASWYSGKVRMTKVLDCNVSDIDWLIARLQRETFPVLVGRTTKRTTKLGGKRGTRSFF